MHDLIDRDRLTERTVELVRLPSINPFAGQIEPNMRERRVAEWLCEQLDPLGFECTLTDVADGRPNVVAIGPGGDGPLLALAGHTDTVGISGYEKPFSGEIVDGRIHGRGSCDMKGALAAFVEVAEVLARGDVALRGRLMILGLADEEATMLGSTFHGRHGARPDFAIVGEPTELRVCPTHKGQFAFPITTVGRAAHSSVAYEGVNAIEHMVEIIEMLRLYSRELETETPHPQCGHPTLNVGAISGGSEVSIVPDRCQIQVDRRLVPGETSAEVRAALEERLAALSSRLPTLDYELGEALVDAGPLETPTDSAVVITAVETLRAHGLPAEPMAFAAATDAPNLGVPAIIWGPGSLSRAHTTDEYVEIDELVTAAHLYLDATLSLTA